MSAEQRALIAEKQRIASMKASQFVRQHAQKVATTESNNASTSASTSAGPPENPDVALSSFNMRRLYSAIDISCERWLLTQDAESLAKLNNPPSIADGIDLDMETDIRYLACELIQSGSILLKLPQTAAATGQILFHRFYYQKSMAKFHFEHTVMACLLLASKIEEAPRRPRDVINVFQRLEALHRLNSSGRPSEASKLLPCLLNTKYVDLKNQVIKAERRLLATLGFVVHVKHPHKLVFVYLHVLKLSENRDVMQMAWSYMNDGLRTDMFLRYTAETIACACIWLAARKMGISLPQKPFLWHELFDASDRDMRDISHMLCRLYQRKHPPNWDRLLLALDTIRFGEEDKKRAEEAAKLAEKREQEKKSSRPSDRDRERDRNRDHRDRDRDRSDKRRRSSSRSRSPPRDPMRRRTEKSSPRRSSHRSPDDRRRKRSRSPRDKRDRDSYKTVPPKKPNRIPPPSAAIYAKAK